MIDTLEGEIILKDCESTEYYIKFGLAQNVLIVEGCIGDYDKNKLQFSFNADQTTLSLALNVLKQISA